MSLCRLKERLAKGRLYLDKNMHAIARELRPYDVGLAKCRLGREFDGGYVVADTAFAGVDVLVSYGLANDVSFEIAALTKHPKLEAHGFDGSSDFESLPKVPRLHLHREFVGTDRFAYATASEKGGTDSYRNHLARVGALAKRVFLKIDIEGAEWDAFADVPDELWGNVQGVVIELHDLHLRENHPRMLTFLRKLNQHFTLYHVNGNNFQGTIRLFPDKRIPKVLEACYIKTELCGRVSLSKETPPSAYDRPNLPGMPSLKFRYW
jgi:hypothetical protein